MGVCVYTCVSTPHLLVTRLSPSLFHVTTRPQRQCWAACSTCVPWRRGGPRVQADEGTGGVQGCPAACGDARLPDGPRGPCRFLHLPGPWVPPSPGDPGAAGPRPAGLPGAVCLSVLSSRGPGSRTLGSLSPRALRLPNRAAAGFSPPRPQRLCRLLPPSPGRRPPGAALRWAAPLRPPEALPWRRRT